MVEDLFCRTGPPLADAYDNHKKTVGVQNFEPLLKVASGTIPEADYQIHAGNPIPA